MVARILVPVLLSLAGAPVLQADSLSVMLDFCEGMRLRNAAYERWAEELPESNGNWRVIDNWRLGREALGVAPPVCHLDFAIDSATAQRLARVRTDAWLMTPSTLSMLRSLMTEVAGMANVETGLDRRDRTGRFMSVATLLLFTEARIYLTRAFLGALDAKRDLDLARLNIRD